MPHSVPLIATIAVGLAVAFLLGFLVSRLRLPPIIGYQRMANFRVWSFPGAGTWLLGLAWLLGPVILFLEHRASRAATAVPSIHEREVERRRAHA